VVLEFIHRTLLKHEFLCCGVHVCTYAQIIETTDGLMFRQILAALIIRTKYQMILSRSVYTT
jgi:hypothetical protein